jgi:C_GCAxxG_C_C family probable redox protein
MSIIKNNKNTGQKSKVDIALEYFHDNFNCSQSVLTAFGQDFGLTEDQCLKAACAFGAGMGRQQKTCGAITGALIVLGLKYGKGINDDNAKKVETYQKTVELMEAFQKKNGSTNCKELLQGLDMHKEEDAQQINKLHLFETSCVGYVSDAVQLLEKTMT